MIKGKSNCLRRPLLSVVIGMLVELKLVELATVGQLVEKSLAQAVGLHLQPPAEMILRPGKLQLISHDLHGYIRRLVRGQGNRTGLR